MDFIHFVWARSPQEHPSLHSNVSDTRPSSVFYSKKTDETSDYEEGAVVS